MKYTKTLITTFLILFMGATTFAQNARESNYRAWDGNSDEVIDNDEFTSGYNENGYYEWWDTNDDGDLSEEEWKEGASKYYADYYEKRDGTFNDWDVNNDNVIDNDEHLEGTYNLWDNNEDGFLEDVEYNTWHNDGLYK